MAGLRQFYRIRYPETEKPFLICGERKLDIIDLSETGACLEYSEPDPWPFPVSVTVVFPDGAQFASTATVVRSRPGRVAVQFAPKIPFSRILKEQRRLRLQFRHLVD